MIKKQTTDPVLVELLRIPEIPIPEHRFRKRWAYLRKGKVISVKHNRNK